MSTPVLRLVPVVPDADARPEPGERCPTCLSPWWWREAIEPRREWRCSCCNPPRYGVAVEELDTTMISALGADAGAGMAEAQFRDHTP